MLIKTFKLLLCFTLVACTSKIEANVATAKQVTNVQAVSSLKNDIPQNSIAGINKNIPANSKNIEPTKWIIPKNSEWYALYKRLENSGIYGDDIDNYFNKLEGQFSQKPMGIKIKELYKNSFSEKGPVVKRVKDTSPNTTGIPRPWYKDYVTEANAKKCRTFISENLETFAFVEKRYNIPAEVISALIYIETWHGNYLGEYNPLINLASMANSTKVEQISHYTKDFPLAKEKNAWILQKMEEKSNWSYNELKSFLIYCRKNKIDAFTLPSSVYGALGYGQFMPTNIPIYAVDGDNDGIINLFQPADGIVSVGNYLNKNGWNRANLTLAQKLKSLKRYNNSTTYANTIMALSVFTDHTK